MLPTSLFTRDLFNHNNVKSYNLVIDTAGALRPLQPVTVRALRGASITPILISGSLPSSLRSNPSDSVVWPTLWSVLSADRSLIRIKPLTSTIEQCDLRFAELTLAVLCIENCDLLQKDLDKFTPLRYVTNTILLQCT